MKQNPRSSAPFAGLAAALLLTGCTPKIYTSVQRSYPARPEEAPVAVYAETDTLPDGAERLGVVEVKERGAANSFDYGTALTLTMIEANRIGGNGLQLNWQRFPLSQDASHQLGADMVRLPDSPDAAPHAPHPDDPHQTAGQSDKKEKPSSSHSLALRFGYSGIFSEIYLPEGVSGSPKRGLDVTAAYRWLSRRNLGFGIRYSGYFTSLTHELGRINIRIHSFAPEFVCRQNKRNWTFTESLGIGYARYSEAMQHLSARVGGVSCHIEAGFEYRIIPQLGLGVHLALDQARFSNSSFLNAGKSDNVTDRTAGKAPALPDQTGFSRGSVGANLSFHF